MDSKKHDSLLLVNVPLGTPLKIEVDLREFFAIISGIERGGLLLSGMSSAPEETAKAYEAACGAMRTYLDQMLIAKYPPTYKA